MVSSQRRPFEPVIVKGLTARNRIVRSATWLALCDDGQITDRLVDSYRRIAEGGVGTVITGITTVIPNEIPLLGMASIADDSFIQGHRRLVDAVHGAGAAIVSQLAISSYCRDSGGFFTEIDADSLTLGEIEDIVHRFGEAAARAKAAGYDGVQIHVAHFFFLSRFVSPLINHRRDGYGGTHEKRARIVKEIVAEVRRRVGSEYPILAKVNGTDAYPGGIGKDGLIALCREMESAGLDIVEVSGNNTSRTGVRPGRNEGYFMDYARAVRKHTGLKVVSVGGFRSLRAVEEALRDVDMVAMSRPLIREPDLIARWASGDCIDSRCASCNGCYNTSGHVCRFEGE